MCNTIGKGKFAVAGKAIEYQGEAFIAFNVAGSFEEFIQYRANKVL